MGRTHQVPNYPFVCVSGDEMQHVFRRDAPRLVNCQSGFSSAYPRQSSFSSAYPRSCQHSLSQLALPNAIPHSLTNGKVIPIHLPMWDSKPGLLVNSPQFYNWGNCKYKWFMILKRQIATNFLVWFTINYLQKQKKVYPLSESEITRHLRLLHCFTYCFRAKKFVPHASVHAHELTWWGSKP